MESALFHSDLLTGQVPGRDAFHRVPILSGEVRDAVECVPTLGKGRFMGSLRGPFPAHPAPTAVSGSVHSALTSKLPIRAIPGK